MSKTIGILGGMGPEATAYMFELIIKNTQVEKDQDHIPVLIFSNPKIPPRTDAIFKKAPDPSPLLVDGANILKQAGADFIIMPCLTAHHFLSRITSQLPLPFLSLVEESLNWTLKEIPWIKKAGLISSTGTLESGIFHETFTRESIQVITPEKDEQKQVMEAIFGARGIKAGFTSGPPQKTIVHTAQRLIQRGAEAVIAGCTEIPLVLKPSALSVPLIEPMKITARASIKKAGYKLREDDVS